MPLEDRFNAEFATTLSLREKQIQQSYRPVIGVHKWFARRPGSVFRNLLLAEFSDRDDLRAAYWEANEVSGVIGDPFMGGGTPAFEANRLGLGVVGVDINPMAYWVVRQSLADLDVEAFQEAAQRVIARVEAKIGRFYKTRCLVCDGEAETKYFLWVKQLDCPDCGERNDLFPGYLLSDATRHPRFVVACSQCGSLNERDEKPTRAAPAACGSCGSEVYVEGCAKKNGVSCRSCEVELAYPVAEAKRPLRHRMWAMEYHCRACKPTHKGRFFKAPEAKDLALFEAAKQLGQRSRPPCPSSEIPAGDETTRLHRWGYRRYRDMFNERQLLGLGLLLREIRKVKDSEVRFALATVFSDFLRYQNMLCRYDTYALKCQDIFSVHGFPVGLIQCENNVLGIPRVGSGAYRHFVEKYTRAKAYCREPFEIEWKGNKKVVHAIPGERISGTFVEEVPKKREGRAVFLQAASSAEVALPKRSLDGVFTDPPYFDNVQYAELMDFCFEWLRLLLGKDVPCFARETTRNADELTGNETQGRGIEHFTDGLSRVFTNFAGALKPNAPFVFTYHHNDPEAYLPLVVAILDAGLDCAATQPVAAEMTASLHISGTASSILDSVFVCRRPPRRSRSRLHVPEPLFGPAGFRKELVADAEAMARAELRVRLGDLKCLAAGHVARRAINRLRPSWKPKRDLSERMTEARATIAAVVSDVDLVRSIERVAAPHATTGRRRKLIASARS